MSDSDWESYSVNSSLVNESMSASNVLSAYRPIEFGPKATFGLGLILFSVLLNAGFLVFPVSVGETSPNDLNRMIVLIRNVSITGLFFQLIGLILILLDVKTLTTEINSAREQQNNNLNLLAGRVNKK